MIEKKKHISSIKKPTVGQIPSKEQTPARVPEKTILCVSRSHACKEDRACSFLLSPTTDNNRRVSAFLLQNFNGKPVCWACSRAAFKTTSSPCSVFLFAFFFVIESSINKHFLSPPLKTPRTDGVLLRRKQNGMKERKGIAAGVQTTTPQAISISTQRQTRSCAHRVNACGELTMKEKNDKFFSFGERLSTK